MISDFYSDTAFTPAKWGSQSSPRDIGDFSKTEQLRREFPLPKGNYLNETMARTPSNIVEILKDEKELQESIGDGEWYEFGWATWANPSEKWAAIKSLLKFCIIILILTHVLLYLRYPEDLDKIISTLWLDAVLFVLFFFARYKVKSSENKNNIGFNRKTGMVSIPRKGQEPFIAPFYEFIPYFYRHHILQGVDYHLYLGHRTEEIGAVNPNAGKHPQEMYADWALIQRFMDVSKPLPDIPLFEPFRLQDPTTKAYDAMTGRPEHYWRDMDTKKATKLHDASYKRIRQFPVNDQSQWREVPVEATQWPEIQNL